MQDLYIYINKNDVDTCLKYGIKLSEYSNKILKLQNMEKRGILAFLSPKDSDLYIDENYECIRVNIKDLNTIIYNKLCENTPLIDEFYCDISEYSIGDYELPEAIICSSILQENLSIYNKILDKPLLVQNSREFYYEKSINDILDSDKFSKYELYQMLLILGDQKKVFKIEKKDDLKLYKDPIYGKTYTKRSNFY